MLNIGKMEEAPVEKIDAAAGPAASNEPEPEPIPVDAPAAAPKKRGRPAGVKDSAPRKKRVAVIVEPLAPPSASAPSVPPAPTQAAPAPRPEVAAPASPPSPRTMLRDASRHILQLQRLKDDTRKSYMQSAYTQHLHAL